MGIYKHLYLGLVLIVLVCLVLDITSAGKNNDRDKKKGNKAEREKEKERERERERQNERERSDGRRDRKESSRRRSERSRHKNKQCYEIQTDFCKDVITYNRTRLPNIFGERKLKKAERELEEMAMVVDTGCSPYLRALLCSIYLPECPHRKKNEPLPPCRQLCERVNIVIYLNLHFLIFVQEYNL